MKLLIEKYRQKNSANIFVIYLRYLIGGAYLFASFPKILGERFTSVSGADAPIDSAWHFFETLYRSGIYWEFLGWSQVIAAFLIMSQRFSTLGALVFFPISINIFVITISYDFGGTPVITGLMLLANIFLLLWDYGKLRILLSPENESILVKGNVSTANHPFWIFLGLLLFTTTVVYVLIYKRTPMAWFLICFAEGLAGFIYMKRKQ